MAAMELNVAGHKLVFVQGDITRVPADAIVNAANSALRGGGGVDGAIHRAGGPAIMEELHQVRKRIERCPPGQAVVTGAGELPADYVIHTVGPVYRNGASGEPELLKSCYETALRLAQEKGARHVSFPSISTGAYGYPMEKAAQVAVSTVVERLRSPDCRIDKVTFVLFDEEALQQHIRAAETLLQ